MTDTDEALTSALTAHARANFRVTRELLGHDGMPAYVEAEADTFSRYVVFSSPLPFPGVEGGGYATHRLVTLHTPKQASYVMRIDDPELHRAYVAEKLSNPAGLTHPGDREAVALAVAWILGRELVGP